jgi:hypothetical protein
LLPSTTFTLTFAPFHPAGAVTDQLHAGPRELASGVGAQSSCMTCPTDGPCSGAGLPSAASSPGGTAAGAMVQVAVPFATAEIVTFFPVTLSSATV